MYEYEAALKDNNLTYGKLPISLRGRINNFKKTVNTKSTIDPDPDKELKIKRADLIIAEEIQNFAEKELPDATDEDEEIIIEENNPKPNNKMAKENKTEAEKELAKRAIAAGLTETATQADVEAAEKKIADDAAAAEQLDADAKAKAKEDAAAKEKTEADAKAAAAAKAAAEEDILDDLDL